MVVCTELGQVVLGEAAVLGLGECPPAGAFPCPRGRYFSWFFSSNAGCPQMRKGLCCILQRLCGKGGVPYSGPRTRRLWAGMILYMCAVGTEGREFIRELTRLCQTAWLC